MRQIIRITTGVICLLFLLAAVFFVVWHGYGDVKPAPHSIKIGFIGDSITVGVDARPTAVETEILLLGAHYKAVNKGVSGSTTGLWLPGQSYFDTAVAEFKSEGVTIVSILLGTNDAKDALSVSSANYRANMQAIIDGLLSTGTIKKVILNYPPYLVPTSQEEWSSKSLPRLESYMAELDSLVNNVTVLQGDTTSYSYFATHPEQLADGVHPNAAGYAHLGRLWAENYTRLFIGPKVSPSAQWLLAV